MSRSFAFSRRGFGRAALWLAPLAVAAAILPSAPVQAADPIKIGFSMSSTGGLAGGGKSALLALEIWRDDVNAKGGLLGRPIQLINYDDQSNPALVPAIYTKLLDVDKVDFVISSYATNQIAPAMPIVMQRKLLFMALFGTGVNDDFKYDRYFQILPNGVETKLGPSRGFLEVAMTMNPKPQTIALVAANAEYAQNVILGARERVKQLGLKVVYDRSYPPTTTDYHADRACHPGDQPGCRVRRVLSAGLRRHRARRQRSRAEAEDVRRRDDRARVHAHQGAARAAA